MWSTAQSFPSRAYSLPAVCRRQVNDRSKPGRRRHMCLTTSVGPLLTDSPFSIESTSFPRRVPMMAGWRAVEHSSLFRATARIGSSAPDALRRCCYRVFFTDLDPRVAVRGSRDPQGARLWTCLGRELVGNLTTVSRSVRGFTTLLGLYLAERTTEEQMASTTERLFLMCEQLGSPWCWFHGEPACRAGRRIVARNLAWAARPYLRTLAHRSSSIRTPTDYGGLHVQRHAAPGSVAGRRRLPRDKAAVVNLNCRPRAAHQKRRLSWW
jgi:hypothetical protein